MTPIPTTLTTSDARANLYDMMEQVSKYLTRYTITHKGKPQAVLMPIEDLESWEETLEIMSNPKLMKDLAKARNDAKAGRFVSLAEIEKRMK